MEIKVETSKALDIEHSFLKISSVSAKSFYDAMVTV